MAYLHDEVYDNGLTRISDMDGDVDLVLHICTGGAVPADHAAALAASVGNKDEIGVTGPTAGSPNGRQITIGAIIAADPGSVTFTDDATCVALLDNTANILLAARMLASPQGVTEGNDFTLTSWVIRIPAPVS